MAVFIDPPLWPRHGTTWGHLVSDTSLDELHQAARALGIPARAFDRDHYDVPAERYEDVADAGVELVDTRTLVRRLRASGLRVTAAQRRGRHHGRPAEQSDPESGSGGRLATSEPNSSVTSDQARIGGTPGRDQA